MSDRYTCLVSSHDFVTLVVYIRSLKFIDGLMFRYPKSVKFPLMGIECFMPFRQSLVRLECSSLSSFVVMEFESCPVYDIDIFSYHRSFPAAFFLLNG